MVKFLCATQYFVSEVNTGVTNVLTPVCVPDCKEIVAVESANQSIVLPDIAVAEIKAVSEAHLTEPL